MLDRLVSTFHHPAAKPLRCNKSFFPHHPNFIKSGFKFFNQEAHVLGKEDEHRLVRDRRLVLLVSILYIFFFVTDEEAK